MRLRLNETLALVLSAVILLSGSARADILKLEQFSGPSTFGDPAQTLTINGTSAGTVTISGGTVLSNEAFLPADESTVYGTCYCGAYSQTITLTFQNSISNFFLDLYNGETYTDSFAASDNEGDSITEAITSNHDGGNALISFPAAGTRVTITTNDPFYDFSIDNIGFDQATPTSVTPEPGSVVLLGTGLLGLVSVLRRRPAFKKVVPGLI